ncbi:Glutamate decarboxylase, partial [Zea mays]
SSDLLLSSRTRQIYRQRTAKARGPQPLSPKKERTKWRCPRRTRTPPSASSRTWARPWPTWTRTPAGSRRRSSPRSRCTTSRRRSPPSGGGWSPIARRRAAWCAS